MTATYPTPGQTIGPFYGFALPYPGGNELVPPGHPEAIRLHGYVTDGHVAPVPDALIEIWQADPRGRVVQVAGSLHRDGWTFTGWGRAATDNDGHYTFTTLRPGPHAPGRPAFVAVTVFARGLLDRLFTRAYLPVGAGPTGDPLLDGLDDAARQTLIAVADGNNSLRFDLRLQGERETVFLRYR